MENHTNSDAKYVSLAVSEAEKSDLRARLGCVAVVSGKVIARGYNNYRTYSKDGIIEQTCSCHAEMDVLRKCLKQNIKKKISLYIARVTTSGELACSAPCIDCFIKMKDFNMRSIIYIGHHGEIVKRSFDDFNTNYMTSGRRALNLKRVKCI